jgi:hypothetical protein
MSWFGKGVHVCLMRWRQQWVRGASRKGVGEKDILAKNILNIETMGLLPQFYSTNRFIWV